MVQYLGIEKKELETKGALFTAMEIAGQPKLWNDIYNKIEENRDEISGFINKMKAGCSRIILTGAGTSAYIGYSLEGLFNRATKITTLSVATTHLVSHPYDYFDSQTPTLMVSFARSGNSPESVAAIELAEKCVNKCYHLIITCNADGKLANYKFKNEHLLFCLPPESNDKSLAMTGSYSGMLLAALLIAEIDKIVSNKTNVDTIVSYGNTILGKYLSAINEIAKLPFNRAVFLGSGPLYGTSVEAQLKLQELTDGQVICKNDSYLGFRHGPKAVVNEYTLLVYFFSNKPDVFRYERDLVKGMKKGKKALYQLGVSESQIEKMNIDKQMFLGAENNLPEAYLAVPFIMVGQMLGFFKSLNLNLKPDMPSVSGAISRVVEGVVIY